MSARPIYVEIFVRCDMDELWERTQNPELHERWDLRFTNIDYVERDEKSGTQRFTYSRDFGPMTIVGVGETVGEKHRPDGTATSALRFWSDDWRSLIREGSGYWRYIPTPEGIRFLTRYDYEVRYGPLGRVVDRILWRPTMGWGTAWSFDRLRLWLEEGVQPERSMRSIVLRETARLTLAAIWLYQGLVPKLFGRDAGEIDLLNGIELFQGKESRILTLSAFAELAFGTVMLARPRSRGIYLVNAAALPSLAATAWRSRRSIFSKPFNPATLTLAMMALALVGYVATKDAPTAARCTRTPAQAQ
ncbi:MAG TPA: DoxX-like family protein [Actinomycetota bacterium]|nr:DoxX-like family protein [Actinomycetota bacterium]